MKAAKLIWESWESGHKIGTLPYNISPKSRKEAYEIQENLAFYSNISVIGWKIAATSLEGQKHIGVSGPLAGRILKDKVFQPNDDIYLGKNKMAVAEPEFAFKMGKTLRSKNINYSLEEVMQAVDTLHLSIELPDSRFEEFSLVGELNLIADNACAHQFVIAQPVNNEWRMIDLSKHKVVISNSNEIQHEGVGSNVLGDPRVALTWLVNELSQNNISLDKGMIVSTGTCAKPIPIKVGDTVRADYGQLGSISVILK
ncbi:ABC transporter permease [Alphaproteobacteria bacterium]|nr:ABC transporter permease [Alphaproteobacteria bacterium]